MRSVQRGRCLLLVRGVLLLPIVVLASAALADGLRVAGSGFGVAAPEMDFTRLLRPGADDGDLPTPGRTSLRYALLDQPGWHAGLGVSAWETTPLTAPLFAQSGYVPLLHAFGEYRFWRSFRLAGDVDAFGGTQGRGVDAGMRLSYDFSPAWSISAAYRLHREDRAPGFDLIDQGSLSFGTRLRF